MLWKYRVYIEQQLFTCFIGLIVNCGISLCFTADPKMRGLRHPQFLLLSCCLFYIIADAHCWHPFMVRLRRNSVTDVVDRRSIDSSADPNRVSGEGIKNQHSQKKIKRHPWERPPQLLDANGDLMESTRRKGNRKDECGIRSTTLMMSRQARIIGGTEVTYGEEPWQADIRLFRRDSFEHICGGAIISNHLVVTAAHCVQVGETIIFASFSRFSFFYFKCSIINTDLPTIQPAHIHRQPLAARTRSLRALVPSRSYSGASRLPAHQTLFERHCTGPCASQYGGWHHVQRARSAHMLANHNVRRGGDGNIRCNCNSGVAISKTTAHRGGNAVLGVRLGSGTCGRHERRHVGGVAQCVGADTDAGRVREGQWRHTGVHVVRRLVL